MAMADVILTPATDESREEFDARFQDYLKELSALNGARPNRHGRFEYVHYDRYWWEPGRTPFFIERDGGRAGLLLLRELLPEESPDNETSLQVAEIFVFPSHRRRDVAVEAMRSAAAMAEKQRMPLTWSAYMNNGPAVALYGSIFREFGALDGEWATERTRGIDYSGLARFYYKMTPVAAMQASGACEGD
jgi:predicted acetyltransferase